MSLIEKLLPGSLYLINSDKILKVSYVSLVNYLVGLPCDSRVGEGPKEQWPVCTAPLCVGYTGPSRSITLPNVLSDKDKQSSAVKCSKINLKFSWHKASKEWRQGRSRSPESCKGMDVSRLVTFFLCEAFSAQWKLVVNKKSRPTKRLLRVNTSATMDHCQLSLDTANSPPASTAPGPGPANLKVKK